MNKTIRFLVIGTFAAGIALAAPAAAPEGKVAYVDLQKVFQGNEKAKKSEDDFKKEVSSEQAKVTALQEEIKKMQAELEKQKDVLKEEERQKREEELQAKVQEFSSLWRDVNRKLDQRREELERACLDEILEFVKEYGRKNRYQLILDSRVVLFGPEGTDITDSVIKAMHK